MVNNRQNFTVTTLLVLVMFSIQISCRTRSVSDLSKESIIPKPVSITGTGEYFILKSGMNIYVDEGSVELQQIAKFLADRLKIATGFVIDIKIKDKTKVPGSIYLTISAADRSTGEEGYKINITKKMIELSANRPAGLFRAIQTLRQVLPATIELTSKQKGPWKIATGTIIDYPAYEYRGAMLDVARHFFGVDDVKRFIDLMSYYKFNVLHLHLSDDQGWRIEIKSWPNLTLHGGSTKAGGGDGGFYTQVQYADIVQYAKERYITIVPEIDMPGHTNAALASYAELNCNGKATELYTGTKVGFSTLCTDKDVTYKFINDVVGELAALTPGPYFHIGGDESHVTKKEDYITFINKVQEIVTGKGKQVIGWDEISLSTLKANSVAQYWANSENANRAASQGAKIIMSPAAKAYIDMQYDSTTTLGQHWAGYIEVSTAYNWDPATLVPGIDKEKILGIEAPLWTETITNMDELEYMVFPRLPGYAEIGWSPSQERDWNEYRERLGKHGERFSAMDINYYQSKLVQWGGTRIMSK
jgi:hexosaminidase